MVRFEVHFHKGNISSFITVICDTFQEAEDIFNHKYPEYKIDHIRKF